MTSKTAVILIDPFNEFPHPDGKLYHRVSSNLIETDTVAHLKELVVARPSPQYPNHVLFPLTSRRQHLGLLEPHDQCPERE